MAPKERTESEANLLIGTQASDAELDVLISSSRSVQLESDPAKLLQRASERSFDLIVLDAAMASIEGTIRSNAESSAVLVTSRTRLLKAVREAAAPGNTSQGGGLAAKIVQRLLVTFELSDTRARPAPPDEWIGTLVTRERSAGEDTDLRRRALIAAFEERRKVLDDSLSTQEVANLLGSTRQTPHDRVKSKSLLAIEDNGHLRFPLWQFDAGGPNGVIEGLPEVLRALSVGPLAQSRWLTSKNQVLDGLSPIEILRTGTRQRVVDEARAVAAQAGSRSG